jgi:nitroimidazol reductase NimA-like FMN-containing flavoprotein (pyridoxamine 5'-phosphate oxidase superfamily)
MRANLNDIQIDDLLLSQSVGHLGFTENKKPYVLPITYVYLDGYIYSQTWPGQKLTIMRENPLVCFEVCRHTDMFNWQSAVVWGTFEELNNKEAMGARVILYDRIFQFMTPAAIHGHEHAPETIVDDNRDKPILFRIKITEKTGRFRSTQNS